MLQQPQSARPKAELGFYLNGERVKDDTVCGQHPLFYGMVQTASGVRHNAYVKLMPGKLIYAEVLSALLGQALSLPIPTTIPVVAKGSSVGLTTAGAVMALASLDTSVTPIARLARIDEVSSLLSKWSHIRTAIVFDELIANADRHLRNILVGSDGKLWLIDHEEAMKDPRSSAHRQIHNHLLKRLSEELNSFTIRRSAQMLKEAALPVADLNYRRHAHESLPHACFVPEDHVESVIEFLIERINFLPRLIDAGLGIRQSHLDLKANDRPAP